MDEVKKIAEEQGAKLSQVALSWITSQGHIAIVGTRTLEQLKENLDSINVNLTASQRDRLNKISSIRSMYPNWMIERQNSDRDFEKIL